MQIRRWAPEQDDFPASAPASVVDDGSDWWGGVTHVAAKLALAVSLSASTLSAQIAGSLPHDDDATQLFGVPVESEYLSPVPSAVAARVSAFVDDGNDLPVAVVAVCIDEDGWIPTVRAVAPRGPAVFLESGDEIMRLGVDDEPWAVSVPRLSASSPIIAWANDTLPVFSGVVGALARNPTSAVCSPTVRTAVIAPTERTAVVSPTRRTVSTILTS